MYVGKTRKFDQSRFKLKAEEIWLSLKGGTGNRGNGESGKWGNGESGERGNGESGKRGNGESGKRGIGKTGKRGNGETENRGIGETGKRGIGETGNRGNWKTGMLCGSQLENSQFYLLSFVETPRKFIIAELSIRKLGSSSVL